MVAGGALTLAVVGAVALERAAELWLSRRNTAWARARGAREVGRGSYRVMASFHSFFLLACAVEPWLPGPAFSPVLATVCIMALLGAQALRWWAVFTLGRRWTTRVIVFPDAEPVTGGPYRWLRHPNYVAVIVEMIALPMVHVGWLLALLASLGNALLLRTRIAMEERALGTRWAEAFATVPRLVPGGSHAVT